jgi:hypothetical protein
MLAVMTMMRMLRNQRDKRQTSSSSLHAHELESDETGGDLLGRVVEQQQQQQQEGWGANYQ